MGKRESKVKDLVEKLQRGELTPKEVKKNLSARANKIEKDKSWLQQKLTWIDSGTK